MIKRTTKAPLANILYACFRSLNYRWWGFYSTLLACGGIWSFEQGRIARLPFIVHVSDVGGRGKGKLKEWWKGRGIHVLPTYPEDPYIRLLMDSVPQDQNHQPPPKIYMKESKKGKPRSSAAPMSCLGDLAMFFTPCPRSSVVGLLIFTTYYSTLKRGGEGKVGRKGKNDERRMRKNEKGCRLVPQRSLKIPKRQTDGGFQKWRMMI